MSNRATAFRRLAVLDYRVPKCQILIIENRTSF